MKTILLLFLSAFISSVCCGKISLTDVKGNTTTEKIRNLNNSIKNKCKYLYENREQKFQSDVDDIIKQMEEIFDNQGIVDILDEYRQLLVEAYIYRVEHCKGSVENKSKLHLDDKTVEGVTKRLNKLQPSEKK